MNLDTSVTTTPKAAAFFDTLLSELKKQLHAQVSTTINVLPSFMYYQQKLGPRAEYRRQEGERIKNSATLAERFNQLKSLTVDLAHFGPEHLTRSSQLKYTVNLAHAKSVFRFDCPNQECVQGDFDLSADLANAVAARRTSVSGEVVCQGWRSKTTIDKVCCDHMLRYTLTVGY
jgi:hypothetical protein